MWHLFLLEILDDCLNAVLAVFETGTTNETTSPSYSVIPVLICLGIDPKIFNVYTLSWVYEPAIV